MKVVCLGLMVCDILVKPISKDVLDRDTSRVDFVKMSSGGDAFNVAVGLSKLGVSSKVIGKVGDDAFGKFLMDSASKVGVEVDDVIVSRDYGTSTSVVLIHPDGERSFAYYGGATDSFKQEDIDFGKTRGAGILSIGSAFGLPGLDGDGLKNILKKAKDSGMETVLDVTGNLSQDSMSILKPALNYVDIFIPSYDEVAKLTGKNDVEAITDELIEQVGKMVVIKMSNQGCFIRTKDQKYRIPAFKVEAVDTTGAGDSFVAGFISAYTRNWSIDKCGEFANAVGAMCVREVGANTGIKTMDEVQSFIADNKSK